ncbi:MAG: hypothetical protein HOI33_09220 [Rhodospirillaceae bacterium]|jgi:hypothetical protein|nr:hypothetical protein [Rhodospirillaceae bacterium]MBT5752867.1 hypothetical protein [Rhodospirillaceae bacterium]
MAIEPLQYDQMVEEALRSVIRRALAEIAEDGLSGKHQFYITFLTDFPGVDIPDHLHAQHPGEMTIVLEHQFWGLEVGAEAFEVTLSFNKANERLTIPFEAITAFADPSVKFGLQFQGQNSTVQPLPERELESAQETGSKIGGGKEKSSQSAKSKGKGESEKAPESGEVIALDAFRKDSGKT